MESALENPVLEFTYGVDKGSPLSLYDSVVPVIKEMTPAQKEDKYVKLYCKKQDLKQKVMELEFKIEQQDKELEVLKWYELVVDSGLNTKELMKNVVKFKNKVKQLENQLEEQKKKAKDEYDEVNEEVIRMRTVVNR